MSQLLRFADTFAELAHAGQFRKSAPGATPVPYIEHPRAVFRILRDEAGVTDEAMLAAALLHDVVEDTDVTMVELVSAFGSDVAGLVAELTNDPDVPPCGKTASQVARAMTMSWRAAAVKTADKIANLRDILESPPGWTTERRRQYFRDGFRVVAAMSHRHAVLDGIFANIFSRGIAEI